MTVSFEAAQDPRLARRPDGRRVLLVEHGSNRGGLAAARSLHHAGWTVDVVGSGTGLTRHSRSVRSWTGVDYPACGEDGLVEVVRLVADRCDSGLIVPVDETQLLILSRRRDELPAVLPFADHDALERVTDRLVTARAAERAGLNPPRTTPAAEATFDDPSDEYVVKSQTPKLADGAGAGARFETVVGPADAARRAIAEIERSGGSAIVQEVVRGDLTSTTLLTDPSGRLLGQVQQRAERIWPPEAGTSARASTVAVDPELTERALALLEDLGWHGLTQLQFLVDASGTPRLIDVNPRFYGSLALAIGAGVDFPALWAACAIGEAPPARAVIARPGVRYQWLGGDLRHALREPRGGLVRDVVRSLRWGTTAVKPIFSPRDPAPAATAGVRVLKNRF